MQIEEILIIKREGTSYALPTSQINQILRIPPLTDLPMSPKGMCGLCAVGGNIVSAVDMNITLGLPAVEQQSASSRLLSLTEPYDHIALLVSEVSITMDIDHGAIEYIDHPEDSVFALYKSQEDIIQILDLSRLSKSLKMKHYDVAEVRSGSLETSYGSSADKTEEKERFLLFKMANESFAIDIDTLSEIIVVPKNVTKISGTREEVFGMISLREELLLIIDLRCYYGYTKSFSDKTRILVSNINNTKLGLVVDEIVDIRDFAKEAIDIMPENFQDKKISGVIHDTKLTSLIGSEVLQQLLVLNESFIIDETAVERTEKSADEIEVVIFRLGHEEYAINIEEVGEIIDMTAITPVADAPEMIDGVINIRGQVVMIGSLHERLHIPRPLSEHQKIIVCQIGRNRIGFCVDSVSDVLGVGPDVIKKNEDNDMFSHILHLDEGRRLVLLFETSVLLNVKAVNG